MVIPAHVTGSSIHAAMETTTPAGPWTFKNRPVRPLLHTANADRAAKIWMPSVMNFYFLPDMGRMNG